MRKEVERARLIQKERLKESGICYNSQIPPGEISTYCKTSEEAEKMLQGAFEKFHLSGRACNRILRVARTAADQAGKEQNDEEEIAEAYEQVDDELIAIIRKALENIRDYHQKQMQYSWFDSKPDGTILGQKVTALQRVGVYVPGGKAAYPSSVLMNIMPAKVAGVDEIIMVTPPGKDG